MERPSYSSDPALLAIWWAGPIIGAFNLVPILPLDGGNIVTSALDRLLPDRAEQLMIWFSLAVTGAFTVFAFTNDRYRGFILIIGFLLVAQLQMLGRRSRPRRRGTTPTRRSLPANRTRRAASWCLRSAITDRTARRPQ